MVVSGITTLHEHHASEISKMALDLHENVIKTTNFKHPKIIEISK